MVDEEEKEWIKAVFKGSILKKADANQLVRSLLSALDIQSPKTDEELNDDESMSQALKQAMKIKEDKEILNKYIHT